MVTIARRLRKVKLGPRPGEIPLKQFLMDESERHGVGVMAIWQRMARGNPYPGLKVRKAGRKTVWVKVGKA